jgi:hypothetical protein
MNKNDNTVATKNKGYTVAINKDDDTVAVTQKRIVVAKGKRRSLGLFIVSVVMGILVLEQLATRLDDTFSVIFSPLLAAIFFSYAYYFFKQSAILRDWLRQFQVPADEEKK